MCEHVARLPWTAARTLLGEELAELRASIDEEVERSPEAEISLATYRYGDIVVENGRFLPPCRRPCPDCHNLLGSFEGDIPLALILDNCAEVFLAGREEANTSDVPLRVISHGEMFGVFETLDLVLQTPRETPPWGVSAGIRSVWVLAPLGNEQMMKRFFWGSRLQAASLERG
jgi:hypothetical protein